MELCPKCKQEISPEDKEMNRKLGNVQVCGDCYFEEVSETVEKFPIHNPATARSR